MTKYCEDCRYFHPDGAITDANGKYVEFDEPVCTHNHSNNLALVQRQLIYNECETCSYMRNPYISENKCGPNAKLFEPKD